MFYLLYFFTFNLDLQNTAESPGQFLRHHNTPHKGKVSACELSKSYLLTKEQIYSQVIIYLKKLFINYNSRERLGQK